MTGETSGNGYNIVSTFLQMLSLDIPLIIIRAPIWEGEFYEKDNYFVYGFCIDF